MSCGEGWVTEAGYQKPPPRVAARLWAARGPAYPGPVLPSIRASFPLSAALVLALSAAGCTYDYDAPFRCANGVEDGDETGVDCGGSCKSCLGDPCSAASECATPACLGGLCSYEPVPYWAPLPAGPPARWGAAFAPMEDGKLVLFGGTDNDPATPVFGDTWVFEDGGWTEATGATSPAAQSYGLMAEDRTLKRALLLGSGGETWSFGADGWRQESPTGPARRAGAIGYDVEGQTMLVYGGIAGNGSLPNDLFARESAEGAGWTEPADGGLPTSGRWGLAYGFDLARRKLVVFGGLNSKDEPIGQMLEYDPAEQVWSFEKAAPGPRYGAASAYDPEREVLVVWGGREGSSGEGYDDLWEHDANGWREVQPRGHGPPAPFFFASMAYDAPHHRMILYGGTTSYMADDPDDDIPKSERNSVYSYSLLATNCTVDGECGTGHCVDGVCCEDACSEGFACDLPRNPGFCVAE